MKTLRMLLPLLMMGLLSGCKKAEPETARSIYEEALKAYDNDSIHQSEQLLRQSIRMAHEEGDQHTLYLSQLQLAQSLSWGNAQAAFNMGIQALQTYRKHPDNERNHIIILDNIGTYASQCAFDKEGTFDEALRYARKANQMALKANDTTLISQTYTTLANIHWATKEYKKALHCARLSVSMAPPHLLFSAQQVLARTLVYCDSLQEAEAVYRSMDYGHDVQGAYIVESNLAKLALQRNDTKAAAEAIDEAFNRAEELYFHALAQKDAYYQTTLQQAQENQRMLYRQRLQMVFLVGGLLLLLLLAFIVYREVRLRRRQRQIYEHEAAIQREQLQQRDATVDFLKNFIYERSEVVQKLSSVGDRHVSLSEGEWNEVERMLNTIDGDRFARLRKLYPDLREEDLQLCILTRLRLTNRTIGNVYAISISAVQHRKLKLKKEVFGQTDPDITLEQVLENL